jgi:hypothetical protein
VLSRSATGFELITTAKWQEAYPQSKHLLHEEAIAWQKAGIELQIKTNG